jgi:glycine cleavage system transcriptional repressor
MAILGGEFALLMLVSGDDSAMQQVESQSAGVGERLGLRMITKQTTPQQVARDFLRYQIRVTGVDRPGIVQRVAAVLAGRGVNVASLESRLSYAPESGTPMFILEAALQIPSALALADLRRELSQACDEENWDFTLKGG